MSAALASPDTSAKKRAEDVNYGAIYGDIPALYALGIVTPVRAVAKRRIPVWPFTVGAASLVIAGAALAVFFFFFR